MQPYFATLMQLADDHGIELVDAFTNAGMNSSVFYRARKGNDLRFETALRVHDSILELAEAAAVPAHAAATEEANELARNHT